MFHEDGLGHQAGGLISDINIRNQVWLPDFRNTWKWKVFSSLLQKPLHKRRQVMCRDLVKVLLLTTFQLMREHVYILIYKLKVSYIFWLKQWHVIDS